MADPNRITKIECVNQGDYWTVSLTKEFEEEHGGGEQTFTESAPNIHHALDIARGMATVSPSGRTDGGWDLESNPPLITW